MDTHSLPEPLCLSKLRRYMVIEVRNDRGGALYRGPILGITKKKCSTPQVLLYDELHGQTVTLITTDDMGLIPCPDVQPCNGRHTYLYAGERDHHLFQLVHNPQEAVTV